MRQQALKGLTSYRYMGFRPLGQVLGSLRIIQRYLQLPREMNLSPEIQISDSSLVSAGIEPGPPDWQAETIATHQWEASNFV